MSIEANCPVCDGQGYIYETGPSYGDCDVTGTKCIRCSGGGSVEVELECSTCDNGVTEEGVGFCSQKCLDKDYREAFKKERERILRPFERQAELARALERQYSPGGKYASHAGASSLAVAYRLEAENLEVAIRDSKGETHASKVA